MVAWTDSEVYLRPDVGCWMTHRLDLIRLKLPDSIVKLVSSRRRVERRIWDERVVDPNSEGASQDDG